MDTGEYLKRFTLDNKFRLDKESLEIYERAVKQLTEYCGISLDKITKRDIRQWLGHLSDKGYKPWTICSKLTGLKTFFNYCKEEEYILTNPAEKVPFPTVEEKQLSYLTMNKLVQLKEIVSGRSLVERAVVEVLYSTGMRIGEMTALKRDDLNWSERMIHIQKGKRKKGRVVLFTRDCEAHLKEYMESCPANSPYVFASPLLVDRPIHPDSVGKWFRKYSEELGFKVTPHTLRHTFAAHLVRKGMPIDYIQILLGHEEPQQTRYYARLYSQASKEIFDEFM